MHNLTLVIINDDSEEYLYRLFESIRTQAGMENCEIIFVDNCSKDNSIKIAKENGVQKLYRFETKVSSKALLYNIGHKLSGNQFILFAHSDVYFGSDFFKNLTDRLAKNEEPDFISFAQNYADTNYFGNNEIGIDINSKKIFYKQLFQYLPHGMPLYLECSEACFLVNRKWLDAFGFNNNYKESFYEFDLLSNIVNNNGSCFTLKECSFTHYFIELHEKIKTLQIDTELFIRNHGYVFEITKKDYHIMELNNHIEELSKWGISQDEEIKKKDILILSQNSRIEELSAWGMKLDEEIKMKNDLISSQNARIEELKIREERLNNELSAISVKLGDKESMISNLLKQIETSVEENNRLNEIIKSINTASQQILAEQEGRIQPLREKERELNTIYNSRGWKMLLKLYWLEEILLPLKSKRRNMLKAIYFSLKNIRQIFKHINKANLKKFFSYVKKESPLQLFNHIKSYLSRFKPVEKMELQIYDTKDTYDKISFSYSNKPAVTIIIPVYNQWKYTYSCLRSILENTRDIEYEIIIADDVSSDETENIEKYVDNITISRNSKNLGFLLNCNTAARKARGKYILFLNNDTNVQKGWLNYLVELTEKDDKIGMVGSKLVYSDGRLQEAGGIIWKDASGWNYGRLDDPEKPEYNYVKEVDYVSGASIMIRANLWKQIGGFDTRYVPAYYEDTDLSFEVRKQGYKVIYQPKSIVVHFEGISHGTDTGAGIKSYQSKNRENFLEKWEATLENEQFENGQILFKARDRSGTKKSILIIDHYVPNYDKDAGGKCTYMYIKLFIKLGLHVTFIGDNFYPHEPYTSELQQLGVEVLYGNYYFANWQRWLKENGRYFDYAYLNRPHISIKYIDMIREFSDAKIIYFGHDLHYLRERRGYELTGDKKLLESSEEWKRKEFELFKKADVIHVVGSYEQRVLSDEFPEKPIRNIPVYFYDDIKSREPIMFSKRKDIIFVGGFGHAPNVDAVMWFAQKIYPTVLKKYPDIKWYVVGSNPPEKIKELASGNIIVTSFVSDERLSEFYETCRMSVVPLRYGAGVKGKVIESIYNRIPLITTSIGAEGLSLDENAFIIADEAEDFAQQVIDVYSNFERLEELSKNCIAFIQNNFTTKRAKQIIEMDIKSRLLYTL